MQIPSEKAFFYETHTSKTVIPFSFLMEGSFYLSSYKIIVCKYIFFEISSDVTNVAIPLRIFFINLFLTFPGGFHIRQNQCFEDRVVQNRDRMTAKPFKLYDSTS